MVFKLIIKMNEKIVEVEDAPGERRLDESAELIARAVNHPSHVVNEALK